jgi:Flp pilus assembly pilin Flp
MRIIPILNILELSMDGMFAGSEGQSLLEYSLILALICIGAICSMIWVGQGVVRVFTLIYKTLVQ